MYKTPPSEATTFINTTSMWGLLDILHVLIIKPFNLINIYLGKCVLLMETDCKCASVLASKTFDGIPMECTKPVLVYTDVSKVNQTILPVDPSQLRICPTQLRRSLAITDHGFSEVDHQIPQPLVNAGNYVVRWKYLVSCCGETKRVPLEWYEIIPIGTYVTGEQIQTRNPFNIIEDGTVHQLVLQKILVKHFVKRDLCWFQRCFTDEFQVSVREIVISPGFAHYVLCMHDKVESATSLTMSSCNIWFSIWNYPTDLNTIPDDTLSYVGVVMRARIEDIKDFFPLARPLVTAKDSSLK